MSVNSTHRFYVKYFPAAADSMPWSWQGFPAMSLFVPLYRLGSGVTLLGGTAGYLLCVSSSVTSFYRRNGSLWQELRSWSGQSASNFCCLRNAVVHLDAVYTSADEYTYALEILRDDGTQTRIEGAYGPRYLGSSVIAAAHGTNTFAVCSGDPGGSDFEIDVIDAATGTRLRRLNSADVGGRGAMRNGDGCLVVGYDRSIIIDPAGVTVATVMNKRGYALLTPGYLDDAAGTVFRRENSGFTATGGVMPTSGIRCGLSVFDNFCNSYRLMPEGPPVQESLEQVIATTLPDRSSPVVWYGGVAYANVPVLNDASMQAEPQLANHLTRGGLPL